MHTNNFCATDPSHLIIDFIDMLSTTPVVPLLVSDVMHNFSYFAATSYLAESIVLYVISFMY